ncbi:hypothetical protein QL285_062832 [Trifolium repens]|nr:hypothetical protein QL285_062832 [Trifolium repens]
MITGRLRPVIKLVLGFGFDFGNENQITCTRSNQHAFGDVLLAYENGLLLCLEKLLGTNRIKLGLVGEKGGVSCYFCCHDRCNSPGECLLAGASVTGHEHARASSTAICKEIVILCLDVPPMIFVFNAVCGGISSTLGSLLLERCLLVIVLGDKLEDLKSFDDVLNI